MLDGFTGKRTFANNVNGEINEGYACIEPSVSNSRLGMSGTCVMNICKRCINDSVDPGLGKYDYISALTV